MDQPTSQKEQTWQAARQRQLTLQNKSGAEQQPSKPNPVRDFFIEHWKKILVLFCLLGFAVAWLFYAYRDQADGSVLLAADSRGLSGRPPIVAALEATLSRFGNDRNGDGTVKIQIEIIDDFPASDSDPQPADWTANLQLFAAFEKQESPFMLLTRPVYEAYRSYDLYEDLAALFPEYDLPLDDAIPVKDTVLYDVAYGYGIPDGGLPEGVGEETYYQEGVSLLDDLVIVFSRDGGQQPKIREEQLSCLSALLAASHLPPAQ